MKVTRTGAVKHIILISALIITSISIFSRVDSDIPRDNEHILIAMEREWNEALKSHNAAWFEKNLADDFTDISSGSGELSGKAEDIPNLKTDKTIYDSLELSDLRGRIEGNAGVVTGVNHIKGHDEQGQTFDVRLSFTDTYTKRHGHWQAWASQHTRVRS